MLIGLLGTNFREFWIKIQENAFENAVGNVKWRLFCLHLNVLTRRFLTDPWPHGASFTNIVYLRVDMDKYFCLIIFWGMWISRPCSNFNGCLPDRLWLLTVGYHDSTVSKTKEIFKGPAKKLILSFTVISDVYKSFIWNKTTFAKFCLTQWISKLLNPLNKAVSGKVYGYGWYSKRNCLQYRANHFSRLGYGKLSWLLTLAPVVITSYNTGLVHLR